MPRLSSYELPQFLRRYRFAGGRVRRVRVKYGPRKAVAVELHLLVRPVGKDLGDRAAAARLVLRLTGVDEFRFQMRPMQPRAKLPDVRIAYLNNLFYVALDPLPLDPGEKPAVHDFRASEAFAAGRDLEWEEQPRKAGA